jgi:hypothetical protein
LLSCFGRLWTFNSLISAFCIETQDVNRNCANLLSRGRRPIIRDRIAFQTMSWEPVFVELCYFAHLLNTCNFHSMNLVQELRLSCAIPLAETTLQFVHRACLSYRRLNDVVCILDSSTRSRHFNKVTIERSFALQIRSRVSPKLLLPVRLSWNIFNFNILDVSSVRKWIPNRSAWKTHMQITFTRNSRPWIGHILREQGHHRLTDVDSFGGLIFHSVSECQTQFNQWRRAQARKSTQEPATYWWFVEASYATALTTG